MERIKALSLALAFAAIVFIGASTMLPWWSLHLSPEAGNALRSDFTVNYNLLKTATASSNALNESATANLSNMTLPNRSDASYTFMDVTLGLSIVGLVLSIPMVLISFFSRIAKYVNYVIILAYLSTAILLVSAMYFAIALPPSLSSLSALSPLDIPSDWPSISPKDIAGAWGTKVVSTGSPLPTWLTPSSFWVWQPAIGWYLTFSAALLIALVSLTMRTTIQKEKKAFKPASKVLNVDRPIPTDKYDEV